MVGNGFRQDSAISTTLPFGCLNGCIRRVSPVAKGLLGGIVAEADAAIVQLAAKGGAALERIIDCFGEHPRLTIST